VRPDFVNVDIEAHPGAIQADVMALPFADESVDTILASHLIEHLPDSLGFMAELYRVAEPGAICVLRCPHGASDDAWEDPTHVRPYFPGSFGYFGQPYYWKAHYGYWADWSVEEIQLVLPAGVTAITNQQLRGGRNVVLEMIATLRAVKPARSAERGAGKPPKMIAVNAAG
jgi:SAM-dependent methyltransferase